MKTDTRVQAVFGAHDVDDLAQTLAAADIAFARVNDTALLATHPHLRRVTIATPSGPVSHPAPPRSQTSRQFGPVPALGEHTAAVREEFLARKAADR